MEAIGIGDFLVFLVRDKFTDILYLMHLFDAGACCSMSVHHGHEDEDEGVIVLLNELVQELASLLDIRDKLKASHMFLPLGELVLDQLNLL